MWNCVYWEETLVVNGINCLCIERVFAFSTGKPAADTVGLSWVSPVIPSLHWWCHRGLDPTWDELAVLAARLCATHPVYPKWQLSKLMKSQLRMIILVVRISTAGSRWHRAGFGPKDKYTFLLLLQLMGICQTLKHRKASLATCELIT